jgi:curved DNA-binding protein CbpA
MSVQTYFKTLGLSQKVTTRKAKEAYINLVRIWHPDQFSNDPEFRARAEDKLKEINVAYSEVRFFLARQNKSYRLLNPNIKKISLTLSTCGDIVTKTSIDIFTWIHRFFRCAYSGDTILKSESPGSGAFKNPVLNSSRHRHNQPSHFQNVLDDVIREKTQTGNFGL